ncbi:MAG: PQQ-binding-like beta-propeller repeat protein [Planctomycetaceae bacterium]
MRALGAIAAWTALAAVAAAGDWAYWRGPEMVGVSRETNLPSDWSLEPKKNVLWADEIGGRATPCVLNDRVYLAARTAHNVEQGSEELIHAGEQVVCRDAKTGDVLWKDEFPVFNTDIPAPRVGWASLTGDAETGNIYHHSVSGTFRCYSADGKRLWEHSLVEEYGEITGYGGRITTPIVDEDRVILGFPCLNWGETGNPPPKHTFYAFDKRTGELLWAKAPGGRIDDTIYTNPVIAVIDGVRQLICGNADGAVYGINARTGEKLWGFELSRRGILVSPVVEGKYVYISQGEDNIDTTEFGRVQCIDASLRGDITKTGGVWRVNGVRAGYSSPTIHDGVLYLVTDSGMLIAFDAKDGKRLWEYKIGTVGKGSPVWADGKIYVMEVNGRIHILKVDREKATKLSDVTLPATGDQQGNDEIYASPALSNGRVYFVTRDRTICIADPGAKPENGEIPPMAAEADLQEEVASLQLIPYETMVDAGEKIEYEVRAFDKNGRFLRTIDDVSLSFDDALKGATVEKNTLTTSGDVSLPQAGVVTVKAEGQTATARIRSFPPLPWKWDMEGLETDKSPATWVNAVGKLKATQVDGNTVLAAPHGPGKPSFTSWLGPPNMKSYVIQADVMSEGRRALSSVGVTSQRYDMILKTDRMVLGLQTWTPHLRINEELRLEDDPANKWFTMKLAVDVEDGQAHLRGKMWPKGEGEPAEWTIETTDPHPIDHGSPGLYVYRLRNATAYFDNVIVSAPEESAASK